MKKLFHCLKMLFGGSAISGDSVPLKAFSAKLLTSRNSGEGVRYVIRFGVCPDFVIHYHIHGLSRKEVRRDLAAIYSLWLDVDEALVSPDAQAELFKVYGALARIDYMDHCAYVPVGVLPRITIPNGSRCTRLAPEKLGDVVHHAEAAANAIYNPCPRCHRQMPEDDVCRFCEAEARAKKAQKKSHAEALQA